MKRGRAGRWEGQGRKASPLLSQLLPQAASARPCPSEGSDDDRRGHYRRMTVWADFILDLDQSWNLFRAASAAQEM